MAFDVKSRFERTDGSDGALAFAQMREAAITLGNTILTVCPESEEKYQALANLAATIAMADAAIGGE